MRRFVLPLAMILLTAPIFAASGGIPGVSLPLRPSSVRPGSAGFTLHLRGTNFTSGAVVNWNGVPLATTFVNQSRLRATVPETNVATAGTVNVTVTNPAPARGTSSPVFFTVTTPTPSLTFETSVLPVGLAPGAIVAGDFNNDGNTDLAVLNMNQPDSCYNSGYDDVGTIQILLGNGDAGFSTVSSTCLPGSLDAMVGLPSLVAEDLGNGNLGLAAEWGSPGAAFLSVYPGNGNGTLNTPGAPTALTDATVATIPAFADFNNDGFWDFAFVQQDEVFPGLIVALGNAEYNFGLIAGGGDGCYLGSGAFAGDFNGDGIMDLAILGYDDCHSAPGPVVIALGTGGGYFSDSGTQPSTTLVQPVWAVTGDFNGDGILDVAFADAGSTSLTVLLGNGDGTFTQKLGQPDAGQTTQFIATADMDGDGKLDLILVNSANAVLVYLGNGDGTFQTPLEVGAGSGASRLAIGDFNGDGRLDLAVVNTRDNTVSLLIQNSASTVSPSSIAFGKQAVETCSNPRRANIKNTGSAAFLISSIVPSGNFSATNTCDSILPTGHSCQVEVVFQPTATGPTTGSITITDNASDSPQVIELSGTGN